MKILIVSQYFYPENFRINDLAQKLLQRGHQVSALTGMPNYPTGQLASGYSWPKNMRQKEKGVEIFRVPLFRRRESRGWQLAINYLSFVISACFLGPLLLRAKKFDVIFSVNYSPATVGIPAILMSKIKQAPMIFWVQDLWPQSLSATGSITSPGVLKVVGSMMSWIYQRCDLVMVQSRAFIEPMIKLHAPLERIRYFPNWAEDIYGPVSLDTNSDFENELPVGGFTVMFAGNLGEAQSLETIIDAAHKLRELPIHWVILGAGRKFDWLNEQIKAKKLEHCIHMLGSKPMELMPQYFSLADVMLVTLRADPIFAATIPGKIQSYLACHKPLIGALDGEGAKVINDSQSGIAVAAEDADGLASAVSKMLALNLEERLKLGQNAFNYYQKNFNSAMLIDRLESEMESLLEVNA